MGLLTGPKLSILPSPQNYPLGQLLMALHLLTLIKSFNKLNGLGAFCAFFARKRLTNRLLIRLQRSFWGTS